MTSRSAGLKLDISTVDTSSESNGLFPCAGLSVMLEENGYIAQNLVFTFNARLIHRATDCTGGAPMIKAHTFIIFVRILYAVCNYSGNKESSNPQFA